MSFRAVSRLLPLTFAAVAVSLWMGAVSVFAATYTVDTLTDSASDASCVDGDVSFRDAISCAEANAGVEDTIAFSVSGTITLTSDGPIIAATDAEGAVLNCATNITFDGNAGTYKGIRTGSSSVIKGCTFTNMLEASIYVTGNSNSIGATGATERNVIRDAGVDVAGNSNTFLNNFIGVQSDGTTGDGGSEGIIVQSGTGNTIGGDTTANSSNRNLIVSQSNCGILVRSGVGTLDIYGNYIGVNKNGNAALGNFTAGVCFDSGGTYVSDINIGSIDGSGYRNLISGNTGDGVLVRGAFSSNFKIVNNYIGTYSTGGTALANGSDGIDISSATCSGTCRVGSNLISGNTTHGVYIHGSSSGFSIGTANYIGINKDGDTALANGSTGITIDSSSSNTIGSSDGALDAPNIISGNTGHGIAITGSTSSSNSIIENYIGFNAAGSGVVANGGDGVNINGAGTTTLGIAANQYILNIIVGNTGDGVEVASNGGAVGIYSSSIGVSTSTDYGNGEDGLQISGSPSAAVTIGSGSTGKNVISGNAGYGVNIAGGNSHVLKGNRIGINKDADAAVANDSGGVNIAGGSSTTIGGTASGAGNMIAGHSGAGDYDITIGASASGVGIYGNYIGMNSSGTAIPSANGILVQGSSTTIGSATDTGRNYISGHTGTASVYFNGASTATFVANHVGMNPSHAAVSTGAVSILIDGSASSITIGATGSATDYNVVGSSTNVGGCIKIGGSGTPSGIVIMGTMIGTTYAQDVDRGCDGSGINLVSGTNIYIGTNSTSSSYADVVLVNNANGIASVTGSTVSTVYVTSSKIGVTGSGTSYTAMGNTADGIVIEAGSGFVIGGTGANDGNVIGSNGAAGISINGVDGVVVRRNYIGTTPAFASRANQYGIVLENDADSAIIGHAIGDTISLNVSTGSSNWIGFNTTTDIDLDGVTSTGNSLRGNVFDLSASDTSTNISVDNANNSVSLSGTSLTTKNTSRVLGSTNFAAGSKVDVYSITSAYVTTYEGTATVADGAFQLDQDFTATSSDQYYYQIAEADSDTTALSAKVTVDADSTGPSVPVVTSSSAATVTAAYTLTGTKDAYSSVLNSGSQIVAIDSTSSWSYATTLFEGTNTFVLTSRDYSSNASSSTTFSKVLDTVNPDAPTITSATSFSASSSNLSVDITGTKEADASIKSNGTEVVAASASTTFGFVVTLSAGTTNYSVTQVDSAGNVSSAASYSVTYTQIASNIAGGGGGGGSSSSGTAGSTTSAGSTTDTHSGESELSSSGNTGATSGESDTFVAFVESPVIAESVKTEEIKATILPAGTSSVTNTTLMTKVEADYELHEAATATPEATAVTSEAATVASTSVANLPVPVTVQSTLVAQVNALEQAVVAQADLKESVQLFNQYLALSIPILPSVAEQDRAHRGVVVPQTRVSLLIQEKVAQVYASRSEDSDGDRVPDWWERKYFGRLDAVNGETKTVQGLNMKTAFIFGLDPTSEDTDGDGLKDIEEIANGADATLSNTGKADVTIDDDDDNDGIPNWMERASQSDSPKVKNGAPVEWAEVNGLDVEDYGKKFEIPGTDKKIRISFAMSDNDGDGLTDEQEAKFCTNPKTADSNGDGINDYDAVNVFYLPTCGVTASQSSADVKSGRDEEKAVSDWDWVDSEKIYVPRLFNIKQDGNVFSSEEPVLAGVVKPNQKLELLFIRTDNGSRPLGSLLLASLFGVDSDVSDEEFHADASGKFLARPKVAPGEYTVIVRAIGEDGSVEDESVPYSFKVDPSIEGSDIIVPEQLDQTPIDLESLEIITIGNSRPYLYGQLKETNYEVHTNWQSQLYTSSLLVDTEEAEFVTLAPNALEEGDHDLTIYAEDGSKNFYSSAIHLDFRVLAGALHGAAAELKAENRFSLLMLFGGAGFVVVLAFIWMVRRRGSKTVPPVMPVV